MSFVSALVHACRLPAVLYVSAALSVLAAGVGHAADQKPAAVPPAPRSMAIAPSGAELVGRLLSERSTASDPDIPLPQRDLIVPEPVHVPLAGPRLYGRGEEGSVVLGLKFPIPADRGVTP